MDYLALDTNIYISMCQKREETVTGRCYEGIIKLLDENKVKLILPEIVKIEFPRSAKRAFEWSKVFIIKTIENLDKVLLPLDIEENKYSWKTMDKLKKDIKKNLEEIKGKLKAMSLENQIRPILSIMEHDNTTLIQPSDKTVIKAYKRSLEQKAPASHKKESRADCLIVESLIETFSDINEKGKAFFISHNGHDFADPDDEEQWHPDLRPIFESLEVKYSPNLAKVLKEEFSISLKDEDIQFEDELGWPLFEVLTLHSIATVIPDAAPHYIWK